MSILLTERAAEEVKRFLTEGDYEDGSALRVAVSGGG